jgi:sugar lactone lactonase YvrE
VTVKTRARPVGLFALAIVLAVICGRASQAEEPATPVVSTTSHKPAPAIFVANPTLDSLSVFPLGSNGNMPSLFTRTFLAQPSGIAYWKGNLYVTNTGGTGGYSVTAYPVSGGRRPAPIFTITDGHLIVPQRVALDPAGNIYVANEGVLSGDQSSDPPSVTIYRAGTNGHYAPMARIIGPKTGLCYSQAVAVDSHGYVYVSNQGYVSNENPKGEPPTITVYAPGSNGDVAPARVISGPATLLSAPEGIAIDSSGRLFVSSSAPGTPQGAAVLIFAPGSNGNVAPFASIDLECAKIRTPGAITLDSKGDIYVTTRWNIDTGSAGIAAFTQQLHGTGDHLVLDPIEEHHPIGPTTIVGYTGQCLTPILSISGKNTGISHPDGIAVDRDGNIYVTNSGAEENSIGVFSAGANGNVAPAVTIESPTKVSSPSSVAIGPDGKIYVANGGGQDNPPDGSNAITVYPPGSDANVAEIATISGSGSDDKTGISFAEAIAVDAHGKIYLADSGGKNMTARVAIFSANSDGNVAPIAAIAGDKTGLAEPTGLALDSAGALYVLNDTGGDDNRGSITVYPPDANGNVTPKATIADGVHDKQTQLNTPKGLALDSAGNIYVTNASGIDAITVYAAGKFGNVAPMKIISGSHTGLSQPHGIGVDSEGKIYVSNDGSDHKGADTVTVYAAGSSGDAKPIATINGSLTGLGKPGGLAVGP